MIVGVGGIPSSDGPESNSWAERYGLNGLETNSTRWRVQPNNKPQIPAYTMGFIITSLISSSLYVMFVLIIYSQITVCLVLYRYPHF
jgi:hypothetical protein